MPLDHLREPQGAEDIFNTLLILQKRFHPLNHLWRLNELFYKTL
jgi:hypothetical protein